MKWMKEWSHLPNVITVFSLHHVSPATGLSFTLRVLCYYSSNWNQTFSSSPSLPTHFLHFDSIVPSFFSPPPLQLSFTPAPVLITDSVVVITDSFHCLNYVKAQAYYSPQQLQPSQGQPCCETGFRQTWNPAYANAMWCLKILCIGWELCSDGSSHKRALAETTLFCILIAFTIFAFAVLKSQKAEGMEALT